jgi:L-amino acid N-acyltransferase YncA
VGGAVPASVNIRACEDRDMAAVTEIYAHHVRHSLATFELDPPDHAEMKRRRRALIEAGYVYLVAERGADVVGYAYAGPYRARPAYRYTVENSVYIRPGCERCGIGRALLSALVAACEQKSFRQMIAVIGDSAHEASIRLHASLGFRMVGTLNAVGFKAGRWVDSVVMQRPLGCGDASLPD